MQKDFLGSLSSRAIHVTEADPAVGELRPRLASLFEPLLTPIMPTVDKTPEADDSVDVEPQKVSQLHRHSQIHPQPAQDEAPPNVSARPSFTQEETQFPVSQDQAQIISTIVERTRVEQHIEVSLAGSSQKHIEPLQMPQLNKDKENGPQPVTPAPPLAHLSEREGTLENQRQIDRKNVLQAPNVSTDPQPGASMKPAPAALPQSPIAIPHHQHDIAVSPAGSMPKHAGPLQTPGLDGEKENGPQPVALTRPLAPLSERDRALENLRRPEHKDALQTPDVSANQGRNASTKPAPPAFPENRPSAGVAREQAAITHALLDDRPSTRVAPEQIAITHKELQSPSMDALPRLIPAIASLEYQPQTAAQQSEPQAPSIHVTIGRIEVKAAIPAALPKRSAPTASTMSLDEYLRRRQGGNS